jgi:hypothetical protein
LYIFDGWLPETLPDGDLLIIDPPTGTTPLFKVGATSEDTENVLMKRDDPRLIYVDFASVNLLQFKTLTDVEWADTLIYADGGPLLVAGEIDGRQVAIMPFDVRDSDLPLKITWPVLVANLLEWFAPRNVIAAADTLSVGETLAIRPAFEADTVRVTLPDTSQRSFAINGDAVVFAETKQTGLYTLEVLQEGEVIQTQPFAVNLFDANESDITPHQTVNIAGSVIAESVREELGQREFWPEVLLLALLMLLIEWVVYHRRMRVPTLLTPIMRQRRVG